jgi:hypothetical protein
MRSDGAAGYEQLLSDLAIAQAGRGQPGDLPFLRACNAPAMWLGSAGPGR